MFYDPAVLVAFSTMCCATSALILMLAVKRIGRICNDLLRAMAMMRTSAPDGNLQRDSDQMGRDGGLRMDVEMAGVGPDFTGTLPQSEWCISIAGGVAYISRTAKDGYREYIRADLVACHPNDQVVLHDLECGFVYSADFRSGVPAQG